MSAGWVVINGETVPRGSRTHTESVLRQGREHLAAHMVVRADGTEVMPGDVIGRTQETEGERRVFAVTFIRLTRAPGDGTGTNGKIDVNDPTWISPVRELYPSVFGLSVVRRPGMMSPFDPAWCGCPDEDGCVCHT